MVTKYILESNTGTLPGQHKMYIFDTMDKAQEVADEMMKSYTKQKEKCDNCGKSPDDKQCDNLELNKNGECLSSPAERCGDLHEKVWVESCEFLKY